MKMQKISTHLPVESLIFLAGGKMPMVANCAPIGAAVTFHASQQRSIQRVAFGPIAAFAGALTFGFFFGRLFHAMGTGDLILYGSHWWRNDELWAGDFLSGNRVPGRSAEGFWRGINKVTS